MPRLPSAPSCQRIRRTFRGIVAKLLHQVSDRLGRLAEIVGGEVDFQRGTSHAHIVGIQRRVDEIEQAVRVPQMPAPAIHVLPDHLERFRVTSDSALQQMLSLLLRSQAREGIDAWVYSNNRNGAGFAVSEDASTRLPLLHRAPPWNRATSKPASVEVAAKARTGTA